MLAEALEYLITPCPDWSRRLGYLTQAIALRARHRRCRRHWRPHLDACRAFILDAAADCPHRRRAVVLGSGLLLDVPVADLAERFDHVILVDAVHPLPERLKVRRWPNVRMVAADVTGVMATLAGTRTLPESAPDGLHAIREAFAPDFVVSANLLSQLPILPLVFLADRASAAQRDAFARALIARHVAGLRDVAPHSCLITDLEYRIADDTGVVDSEDPLLGTPLPAPVREWLWTIAPRPELYRDHDLTHRVGGFLFSETTTTS